MSASRLSYVGTVCHTSPMTTNRRPRTTRRYPRDVAAGARVLVRMATNCGPRPKVGTITELTPAGNRYRIVVTLDDGNRVRLNIAANAKLDTIGGAR